MNLDDPILRPETDFYWVDKSDTSSVLYYTETNEQLGSIKWDDRYGWDAYSGIDHCYVPWGPFGSDPDSRDQAKACLTKRMMTRPDLVDGFMRNYWSKS